MPETIPGFPLLATRPMLGIPESPRTVLEVSISQGVMML